MNTQPEKINQTVSLFQNKTSLLGQNCGSSTHCKKIPGAKRPRIPNLLVFLGQLVHDCNVTICMRTFLGAAPHQWTTCESTLVVFRNRLFRHCLNPLCYKQRQSHWCRQSSNCCVAKHTRDLAATSSSNWSTTTELLRQGQRSESQTRPRQHRRSCLEVAKCVEFVKKIERDCIS